MNNFETSEPRQNAGSTTAIIIIIFIILLGGVYLWYSKANAPVIAPTSTQESATQPANDTTLRNDLQAAGNVDVNSDMDNLDTSFGK